IGSPAGSAFLTSLQKPCASAARKSLFQKTLRNKSLAEPGRLPALNNTVVFGSLGCRVALRGITYYTPPSRKNRCRLILFHQLISQPVRIFLVRKPVFIFEEYSRKIRPGKNLPAYTSPSLHPHRDSQSSCPWTPAVCVPSTPPLY